MNSLVRFGAVFLMVLLVGCASQGGGGAEKASEASAPAAAEAPPAKTEAPAPEAVEMPPAKTEAPAPVPAEPAPAVSISGSVSITKPAPMADVTSPVEVCMETQGYTVEPAKNGVNEGKGHHHLIIDAELPDLSQPIPKDSQHIHMGDGSSCKTIELSAGKMYTIKALFARGNHIPYDPPVTDSVVVFVK